MSCNGGKQKDVAHICYSQSRTQQAHYLKERHIVVVRHVVVRVLQDGLHLDGLPEEGVRVATRHPQLDGPPAVVVRAEAGDGEEKI